MSPGLRVVVAFTILAFLFVAGLLGGLQELRQQFREDPALAAEIHALAFPIPGIAAATPYKVMDVREHFGMTAVYLRNEAPPEELVLMIVTRMPPDQIREDGDFRRGIQKEWQAGALRAEGEPRPSLLQFRGAPLQASVQTFRTAGGELRHDFLLRLDWGGDAVFVAVNGPAATVTREAVQAALDQVTGDPQLLVEPEPEAETEAEA